MKRLVWAIATAVIGTSAMAEDAVHNVTPEWVMTGSSSAFNDGVWLRTTGQVGHANCYYAPGNVSLYYAKPDGAADPKKVLALLISAKLTGRAVSIEYWSDAATADFWGYGISRCEIRRLVLN